MRALFFTFLIIGFLGCSGPDKERPAEWMGEWTAQWKTDSASFADIEGITSFTMPGKITFDEEKVNIKAFGFEGCAFSSDTLDHSLLWKVRSDSLILINDENTPGMVYQVREAVPDKIELQLMEDIFLTLQRAQN